MIYISTLKMGTTGSSEMCVPKYERICCPISDDHNPDIQHESHL
jgi:hypothetical protein